MATSVDVSSIHANKKQAIQVVSLSTTTTTTSRLNRGCHIEATQVNKIIESTKLGITRPSLSLHSAGCRGVLLTNARELSQQVPYKSYHLCMMATLFASRISELTKKRLKPRMLEPTSCNGNCYSKSLNSSASQPARKPVGWIRRALKVIDFDTCARKLAS